MSAAVSSPGAALAGPALPAGVLATVAFPLGDLAALRELVEHYARLIGARAATLDQPLTLSGDDLLATGGRVLSVVALGDSFAAARAKAYAALDQISLPGGHYRTDIAEKVS